MRAGEADDRVGDVDRGLAAVVRRHVAKVADMAAGEKEGRDECGHAGTRAECAWQRCDVRLATNRTSSVGPPCVLPSGLKWPAAETQPLAR